MTYEINGAAMDYQLYILICLILLLALGVVAIFVWKSKMNQQLKAIEKLNGMLEKIDNTPIHESPQTSIPQPIQPEAMQAIQPDAFVAGMSSAANGTKSLQRENAFDENEPLLKTGQKVNEGTNITRESEKQSAEKQSQVIISDISALGTSQFQQPKQPQAPQFWQPVAQQLHAEPADRVHIQNKHSQTTQQFEDGSAMNKMSFDTAKSGRQYDMSEIESIIKD